MKTTVDKNKDLATLAEEAIGQIVRKSYADEPGIEDAICVGIGVRMKTAEVVFK